MLATARDVATLKASMLEKARSAVASRLADIDWYWSRAAKGGTAVPSNIATYATLCIVNTKQLRQQLMLYQI